MSYYLFSLYIHTHTHTHTHIYIYIYIYSEREREGEHLKSLSANDDDIVRLEIMNMLLNLQVEARLYGKLAAALIANL